MGQLNLGRAPRRRLLFVALLCAGLFAIALQVSAAQAARGFATGLYDGDFADGDTSTQTTAFDRAAQARANYTLVYVDWSRVAPYSRPVGFVPTNPADPNYNWATVDAAVRDASARGLTVMLAVVRAPAWAEGPGRPSQDVAPVGTWRPNPVDVGEFSRAI